MYDARTNFMTVMRNYQIVRDSQDCGVSCEDAEKDIIFAYEPLQLSGYVVWHVLPKNFVRTPASPDIE